MKSAILFFTFGAAFSLAWLVTPRPQSVESDTTSIAPSSRILSSHSASSQRRANTIAKVASFEDQTRQVIALANSIPISELKNWHRHHYLNSLDRDLQQLFRTIISERWLEADPADFLTWIRKLKDQREGFYLAKWAEKDPKRALAFVKNSSSSDRSGVLSSLFQNLVQINPDAAFSLAAEILPTGLARHRFEKIVSALAKTDLNRLKALRESWPEDLRARTTSSIASTFFISDFSRALEFIQSEGGDWKTLTDALRLGPYLETKNKLIENATNLPPGWFEKIFRSNSSSFNGPNSIGLLEVSAEDLGIDAKTHQDLLKTLTNIRFGKESRAEVMSVLNGTKLPLTNRKKFLWNQIMHWDRRDREGLESWLGQLTDPELHATADSSLESFDLGLITDADFKKEPGLLINQWASGTSGNLSLSHRWNERQLSTAIEAFKDLPPAKTETAFNSLFNHYSRFENGSPKFLAPICQHQASQPLPEDLDRQNEIIHNITTFATTWANQEPAKAATWAAQLPDGPSRKWSLKNVARTWQNYSEPEAQAWIKTLPTSDQTTVRDFLEPKVTQSD